MGSSRGFSLFPSEGKLKSRSRAGKARFDATLTSFQRPWPAALATCCLNDYHSFSSCLPARQSKLTVTPKVPETVAGTKGLPG